MSQLTCPYCGSVQIKAMSNQPKKYPSPTDPIALQDWQRGYDCKKCGNDFIITPPKPKKPLGFFGKLIKYSLILIIAFILLVLAIGSDDKGGKKAEKTSETTSSTSKQESIANSQNQNDTLSIKTTLREKDQ